MKRKKHGGGFGGVAELEEKRQYRAVEQKPKHHGSSDDYGLVFDKGGREPHRPRGDEHPRPTSSRTRPRSRSRSPALGQGDWRRKDRSFDHHGDRYEDKYKRR